MALIANPEVLAVGRESCGNRQLSSTANVTVWAAEGHADTEKYVAVFNVNDEPMTATVVVAELPGVPLTGTPPASRRGFFPPAGSTAMRPVGTPPTRSSASQPLAPPFFIYIFIPP